MKTTGNHLQDLRHIQKTLQAQREKEAARQKALQQQRLQEQAQRQQFAHAIGAVQPLRGDHAQRVRPPIATPEPVPLQRAREHAAVLHEALSDAFDVTSLLETDEDLSYRRPEIGEDVVRKLRQGHWSIQAQIDLHGLRRDGAREALGAFIRDCQRQGIRCVRIVTGKGLGSPNRMPVLKHKVHGWLVQKQEVLAFVQARPAEGGAGALVVLLDGRKGMAY
ncbi:MAG: Smr/MutS family protein [Brachymonas sp.]|nr:Smr/MutS family protein [Brachymonas sp.]